jgi:hypothetical protein
MHTSDKGAELPGAARRREPITVAQAKKVHCFILIHKFNYELCFDEELIILLKKTNYIPFL